VVIATFGLGRRNEVPLAQGFGRSTLLADVPADLALLRRIDAYLDAAPRTGARAETIGSFTLFLNEGHGWRYYARPTPGAGEPTPREIGDVRRRQRALSQPERFEWIHEIAPEMRASALLDGLVVTDHPLMALNGSPADLLPPPDGVEVVTVDADDDLSMLGGVAEVAFAEPGTAVGSASAADAAAAARRQSTETLAFQRGRMLAGLTVAVAARVGGVTAAVGWHQPLDGASEIVGVSTLPAYRRRGLGAAVTAALVADALERGVGSVFLSADGDDVARIYGRVGFTRVGTACSASAPSA
jgi:ribosomal protein S18 acetylase RimI-like enzyme